jgi:hypothetical protein
MGAHDDSSSSLLTKADLPEIVQRYRQGESLAAIATESRVCARSLYNWILAEHGPEYQAIQTECLLNRVADADAQLEQSTDKFQIMRAREIARFSRMDLERRRPQLYGPKTEVKQDTTITVIVQREPPVIDIEPDQAQVNYVAPDEDAPK